MYSNPYGMAGDYGSESLAGLGTALACAGIFTLVLVVLYLWLFYRIFTKAGYSGWLTLLNLIPYVGSVIVLFMLALGDWPALKQSQSAYAPPRRDYPRAQPGYGAGAYQPSAPPAQPGYGAPQPSAPAPTYAPPVAPPAPEPVAPTPAPAPAPEIAPAPEPVAPPEPPAPQEPPA